MKFKLVAAGLVVFVVIVAILGYRWQPEVVRIEDASKPIDLTLHSKREAGTINEIHVEGRGKMTGEADVSLMLDGKVLKTERVKGAVRFSWQGEWHASEAVVRYTPVTPSKGAIKLLYRFTG